VLSFSPADPALPDEPRLSLLACPPFAALPERVLRELAGLARRRRYEAEQALFRVGDASESAFVLCSGHVQARLRSREGRELVMHVAVPGEAPGNLDLIDGAPRSADAVAQDDVEVLVLPARAVRRALSEHPRALMELSSGLAGIIRKRNELMRDLVFLDLPARLAKLLLARPTSGGRVELAVTQGELAAQLGVARQSLNRALGDLQRRGLIRVEESGTAVELLDRMALRRLAVGAPPPQSHVTYVTDKPVARAQAELSDQRRPQSRRHPFRRNDVGRPSS
jgi:CRP/FNR family transcriptional regulator, cyclic AMP receptor protein